MKVLDLPSGTKFFHYEQYHSTLIKFNPGGFMVIEDLDKNVTTSFRSFQEDDTTDWNQSWSFEIPKSAMFNFLYDRLKN